MSATPGPAVEAREHLPELKLADALTVKGRKRVSAFASAVSAVLSRWGLVEACRDLNTARPAAKDKIRPAEVRHLCLVMVEAAQRVEWRAEQEAERQGRDPMYSERRRFRASASTLELFCRREQMPRDLDDRDRARFRESRARAFRRRWAKLDAVQCYLHLALFEREEGAATGRSKVAPAFTDYFSDLVVQTACRAAELRGEPINRYNRAADEVLEAFRASRPRYADEWEMPAVAAGDGGGDERPAPDPFKALRELVDGAVADARAILAELRAGGMTEQDEQAQRAELIEQFSRGLSELSDAPPTGGPGDGGARVTPNADTISADASARLSTRTNLSGFHTRESVEMAEESQNSPPAAAGKTALPAPRADVSLADAEAAVAACASVGVRRLKVVFIDDRKKDGEAGYFLHAEGVTLAQFQDRLPGYLRRNAHAAGGSMSVRLRAREETHVLQVDDCTAEQLARLAPFAFWTVQTSPGGNPQAWLAFSEKLSADTYADVRRRLIKALNPTGDKSEANGGAGGAIRWPGSLNHKPNRRLAGGGSPRVEILSAALGRRVAVAELDAAGLLAAPEPVPATLPAKALPFASRLPSMWPSLDEYLSKHRKGDGTPDRSSAEIAWCCAALRMGWPSYMVEEELSRLTLKGRGRRDNYVGDTVRHAAEFIAARPSTDARSRRERVTL